MIVEDSEWRVGVRELIIPASSYFRRRLATDVVIIRSPMVSDIAGGRAIMAVAPVMSSPTIYTTVYTPSVIQFFDLNLYELHDFEFSMTNADETPIQFIANSPSCYLSLMFISDL